VVEAGVGVGGGQMAEVVWEAEGSYVTEEG
jgi:hypothetical protein